MTTNAAYQYGELDHKGTLQPGKLADLVILSGDPLTTDPAQLKRLRVLATLKEGCVPISRPGCADVKREKRAPRGTLVLLQQIAIRSCRMAGSSGTWLCQV